MALASLVAPLDEAEAWIRVRRGDPQPRVQAEACCDLATRCLWRQDLAGARRAIAAARLAAPAHADAERWTRWLGSDPLDPNGRLALLPRAELGWWSEERLRRRGAPGSPPSGTAAARLAQAGRRGVGLAPAALMAQVPWDHPAAVAEIALDRARALAEEGRSAEPEAREGWRLARSLPSPAPVRAAALLQLLGQVDPSCTGLALASADLLLMAQGGPRRSGPRLHAAARPPASLWQARDMQEEQAPCAR